MKKIVILLLVLCTFCLSPSLAAEMTKPTDISTAREALLQIEGSNDNGIVYSKTIETPRGEYYKFSDRGGNEYYVNNQSNLLERVNNRFDWQQTRNVKLSVPDAQQAAQKYVAKYSGIQDRTGLNTVKTQLLDHGDFSEYSVEFSQVVDGVTLPNIALISINPANGELLSYVSIDQDVSIPLNAQLSKDDALKIAMEQYPGIRTTNSDASLFVDTPPNDTQKLLWRITIIGEPVDNMMYGGILAIDANDGRVVYNSPFK
jgi:hypothetical protein